MFVDLLKLALSNNCLIVSPHTYLEGNKVIDLKAITTFLNMNMSFSYPLPFEVQVQVLKHRDVIKRRCFLIHEKSPLALKEGDLIALAHRRGFKWSLRKTLLHHLLDSRKEPQLLNHCRRGFYHSIQKKNKELHPAGFEPPKWPAEMIIITPCHSSYLVQPLKWYSPFQAICAI